MSQSAMENCAWLQTLQQDILHNLFDLLYFGGNFTSVKTAAMVLRAWQSVIKSFLFCEVTIVGKLFEQTLFSLFQLSLLLNTTIQNPL